MPGLTDLPDDLLRDIFDHLDNSELRSLLSTHGRFHPVLRPRLYKELIVHCDGRLWNVHTSLLILMRDHPGIAGMVEEVKIMRRLRKGLPTYARPISSNTSKPARSFKWRGKKLLAGFQMIFGTGVLSLLKRLPNLTKLTVDVHFARSKRLRWREYCGMKAKLPSLRHLSIQDEWQHLIRARELASCCEYAIRCIEGWTGACSFLETLHIGGAFEDELRPVKFHHGRLLPVDVLHLETTQFSFASLQNLLFHLDGLRCYHYAYVGRQLTTPAPKHLFCMQPHKDTLQQLEFDMPCVEDVEVYGRFRGDLRQFTSLKVLKTAWHTVMTFVSHNITTSADNIDAWVAYQLPPNLEKLTLTCCYGYVDKQIDHLFMVRNRVMPGLRELTVVHHRPSEINSENGDTTWSDLTTKFSTSGMMLQVQTCSPQADAARPFDWAQLQDNERWAARPDRTSSMRGGDSDSVHTYDRNLERDAVPRREGQHRSMRNSDASSFIRPSLHNVTAVAQPPRQQRDARTSDASSFLRPPSHFARWGRDRLVRSSSGHSSEAPSIPVKRKPIMWPPPTETREMSASEAAVIASSRRRQRPRGSSAYGPNLDTLAIGR